LPNNYRCCSRKACLSPVTKTHHLKRLFSPVARHRRCS
jgi:hypothetical protein